MRYAGIIKNDLAAAPGVCVTFFVQGCPIHCKGCHNQELWDFNGGKEFTQDVIKEIIEALTANGIKRTFCIMGGEPLCNDNLFLTTLVATEVHKALPETPIYVWTGYRVEEVDIYSQRIINLLDIVDYIVTGPYIEQLRTTTQPMVGSSNQIVYNKHAFPLAHKLEKHRQLIEKKKEI